MRTANGVSSSSVCDFIFLGTATSSTLPSIACLTDPQGKGCLCCRDTLDNPRSKNRRRNTAGVLRVKQDDGSTRTILIDAGKTVAAACIEHFPRHGLRRLDAVLISHAHADAMNGLDDLRQWTLGGAVQDSIDIYCNQATFDEVKRAFPYLVDSSFATGGGDLPTFAWKILDVDKPFQLFGVSVTPLPVHHGQVFSTKQPYICLGFLFDRSIAYLSDVSSIPDAVMELLLPSGSKKPVDVLVIDVLRIAPHASHFGIGQAMQLARQMQPQRTYWLGFAHRATHENWLHLAKAIEAGQSHASDETIMSAGTLKAQDFEKTAKAIPEDDFEAFTAAALREMAAWSKDARPIWARPAFDGLKLTFDRGQVVDDA